MSCKGNTKDPISLMIQDSAIQRAQHKLGDLYVKAADIGRRAHSRQTRWGGEPYFDAHCVKVADLCETYTAAVTALLHDVKEDCEPQYWDEILNAGFPPLIIEALTLLTHDPADSYCAYIEKIGEHYLASYVKSKDLEHNLSDLQGDSAANRQRRDKYQLAQLFLRRKWKL